MLNKKLLIIAISALFCNVTMLAMEAGRGDKYLTSTINKTGQRVEVIVIPHADDWLLQAQRPNIAPVFTYKAHIILEPLSKEKDKLVNLSKPILLNEDPRSGKRLSSLFIMVLRRELLGQPVPTMTTIQANKLYGRSTLVINADGTVQVQPDLTSAPKLILS